MSSIFQKFTMPLEFVVNSVLVKRDANMEKNSSEVILNPAVDLWGVITLKVPQSYAERLRIGDKFTLSPSNGDPNEDPSAMQWVEQRMFYPYTTDEEKRLALGVFLRKKESQPKEQYKTDLIPLGRERILSVEVCNTHSRVALNILTDHAQAAKLNVGQEYEVLLRPVTKSSVSASNTITLPQTLK